MKKLVAAVVSSLMLAGVASAAPSGIQVVTGNVADAVDITVTGTDLTNFVANGTATGTGTLTVNSTGAYTIKVESDVARMSEHDGTAYVSNGAILGANMVVSSVATGTTAEGTLESDVTVPVVGTTPGENAALVFTGSAAESNGVIKMSYSQSVPWGTAKLAGTNKYRMQLTYFITAGAI